MSRRTMLTFSAAGLVTAGLGIAGLWNTLGQADAQDVTPPDEVTVEERTRRDE